jgi:pimeloyl-ACP methyl ester carboxylesterase
METHEIERDGVRLHVEVEGPADAVPVVFLHGLTGSGRTWEWLPPEITSGRRIVRVDLRGHGESGHSPESAYGLADYGADVVAVLRELGGSPAVLVGHSLGGVVSWWIAQSHPELVVAAFLEDPPLLAAETVSEDDDYIPIFTAMRANVLANREEGLSDEAWAERMGAAPLGPPGAPPLREVIFDDAVAALASGHRRLDTGVIDGVLDRSTLAATDVRSPVTVPVTILAAGDNFGAAFSTKDEERLARTYPDVEVTRVETSGHGIHDERRHRDVFVAHLRDFLERYAPNI